MSTDESGSQTLIEVDWAFDVLELWLELLGVGRCPLGKVGDSRGQEQTKGKAD